MANGSRPHLDSVPPGSVTIDDEFWSPRRETNRDVTIEHQYQQLTETGCLDNFRRAANDENGGFEGMWFADSDAYKWLEAVSYAQASDPTPERAERITGVISLVADAQRADGYLNTYFQLNEPDRTWTNLAMLHELYCAGHLIEAATTHYRVTGERSLLDVATAVADHAADTFGPEKRNGAPGHEEIELALVDLARVTGEERYRDLAAFFIDQRGIENSRLEWELGHLDELAGDPELDEGTRNVFLDEDGEYDGRYAQDHRPLREQSKTEGHAVRAMYLYSGAADLLLEGGGDEQLADALDRLWTNMTTKRMYVTGGIGPEHAHEGFTEDYDLPNESAYAETCAAVGSVLWNHRMARLTGDARFVDVLERALYNGFLAGVSLDGTEFFYVNPLESDGDHHREEWFECACCPPNVARLLASLETYLYTTNDDGIYVNLFVGGHADLDVGERTVSLSQRTRYPLDGDIHIDLDAIEGSATFDLHLRIPSWCEEPSLSVNDESVPVEISDGYVTIRREWIAGDTLDLSLPMAVETLVAHPDVKASVGCVALRRGPLVYCLEGNDNDHPLHRLRLPPDSDASSEFDPDRLGGLSVLSGNAAVPRMDGWSERLYRPAAECAYEDATFTAIPYYAWDNRAASAMRVWVNRKTEH